MGQIQLLVSDTAHNSRKQWTQYVLLSIIEPIGQVSMRFNYISYSQLVQDTTMRTNFIQDVPYLITNVLSILPSNTTIELLQNSPKPITSNGTTCYEQGVIVNMTIPYSLIPTLQNYVLTPNSSIHNISYSQLAPQVDGTYFTSGNECK